MQRINRHHKVEEAFSGLPLPVNDERLRGAQELQRIHRLFYVLVPWSPSFLFGCGLYCSAKLQAKCFVRLRCVPAWFVAYHFPFVHHFYFVTSPSPLRYFLSHHFMLCSDSIAITRLISVLRSCAYISCRAYMYSALVGCPSTRHSWRRFGCCTLP